MHRTRRTRKAHPIVAIGLSLSLVMSSLPAPALGEAFEEVPEEVASASETSSSSQANTDEMLASEIFAQLANVPTTGSQANADDALQAALAGEPSTSAGIAHAFVQLAQEQNLGAQVVLGNDGTSWNVVNIAGQWQHVDAARAESADDTRWLLADDAQFSILAPESAPWTIVDDSAAPTIASDEAAEASMEEVPVQATERVQPPNEETQSEEGAEKTEEELQAEPKPEDAEAIEAGIDAEQEAQAATSENQQAPHSKASPITSDEAKNTSEPSTTSNGSTAPAKPANSQQMGLDAMAANDDNYRIAGKADYTSARQILTITNNERKAQGCSTLHMNRELQEVAMRRAAEISLNFSHQRPDGSNCDSLSSKMYAENIAAGYGSAEAIMSQWMNSPDHRSNILWKGFTSMGVGCFQTGSIAYWVQVFGYDAGTNSYAGDGVQNKTYQTNVNYSVISLDGSGFNLNRTMSNPLPLNSGETFQLEVGIQNPGWSAAYCTPDASTFTWKSSNTAIATVSNKGLVKAGGTGGTATITATSPGKKSWSIKVKTTKALSLAKASVSKIGNKPYTGRQIRPKPTVKLGSRTLKLGTDYTLKWSNNVKGGTATITITGKGTYSGTKKVTFKIVAPGVQYYVHRQTYGNEPAWSKANGAQSGTTGESKRLEGIWIRLNQKPVSGSIQYRTHIQSYGWEKSWKSEGRMSGTSGESKRLEAIQIKLTGEMANKYDVYYRVHAQSYGWMGWAKNGASAGTAGQSKRLEAIQIVVLPKGANPPAANYRGANQMTSRAYVKK
ncbi:MAG: Ig-like domain-containing protein [Atopobiaceae bacterium]|nr:Ig-like domain-containing protein [Atopobiaceae bacterium]